jgi:hypothetical protein
MMDHMLGNSDRRDRIDKKQNLDGMCMKELEQSINEIGPDQVDKRIQEHAHDDDDEDQTIGKACSPGRQLVRRNRW